MLPGSDPNDPDVDPIIESNELKDAGDLAGARRILMTLLETDLRCLDAHAHLGNLVFDHTPKEALRHYEVGVRIGELSLGEGFNGVLLWGFVDNRPRASGSSSLRSATASAGRNPHRPSASS